jgi:DUF1680 family protein
LLDFSKKYASYIHLRFIEKRDTEFTTPGHEEIELALWRLFLHTGDTLYKELAEFFLNERGKKEKIDPFENAPTYLQSHAPIREQTTAKGHAVRALYLYIAMADMAIINHDQSLTDTLKTLFADITQRKAYITGGVGSSHYGERFTFPYDLPPFQAYNETCASIAFALFCDKMFLLTGEAVYADQWERVFYNGILCGTSLRGDLSQANVRVQYTSPSVLTAHLPTTYKNPATALYAYHKPTVENTVLTLIPYFAWANREEADMKVWFPEL